jgi:hypothetical protein
MSTNQLDSSLLPDTFAIPPRPVVSREVSAAADRLGVGRYLSDVVGFTLEIFGSFSDARVVPDPEVPDDLHIVFDVPVTGSVDDLVDKDLHWHRRLLATIPRAPRVFAIAMSYQR